MATELPCPICRRPVRFTAQALPPAFPFCSDRCRTADLAAWAEGRYQVAGRDLHDLADDPDFAQP